MKIMIKKCFFHRSQPSLHGHSLKLNKKRVRLDVGEFSFSNRVVNDWNILDEEIISGCSLAIFKRKLDRHLRDKRGYISFSFLPLYRQLDDLDSLLHQVQVFWVLLKETIMNASSFILLLIQISGASTSETVILKDNGTMGQHCQ